MSYFTDVEDMFAKHDLDRYHLPAMLTAEDMDFRATLIIEELAELSEAFVLGDMAGMADAIADLVYVALGTAVKMGLPFDHIWNVVHTTNLTQKIRGGVTKRGNNPQDLVKLETYVDPKEAIARLVSVDLPENVGVMLSFTRCRSGCDYFMIYSQTKGVLRVYLPMDSDIDINDVQMGDLIKFRQTEYGNDFYFEDFV
jgi:phosphoribosyl-ATP pyrophosphohydrolase